MHNHAPRDYICPFCLVVQGVEKEDLRTRQDDIIYRDEFLTAFIPVTCYKNNKGHVLIIPNAHYENIYDLPDDISAKIHAFSRKVAIALKEVYRCDGVSTRQHNEPFGNQDVWHYHLHVFPRYQNDDLYFTRDEPFPPEERKGYAKKLRAYFESKEQQCIAKLS